MTVITFLADGSITLPLVGSDGVEVVFLNPEWLAALLALPLWWLLVWPRTGFGLVHARGDWMRGTLGGGGAHRLALLFLPRLLRSLVLASLVLVLAAPHRLYEVQEVATVGRGLSLVVDLSSSMLARDMEDGRSRMEVAREAAIRFAASREHDEQSLVGFASHALTRVPPTDDPTLIVTGVETLVPQLIRDGTDISSAVLTATARLLESDREPRVAILLTDGAHNGSGVPPLTAARAAAELGVRVHSISILPPEDPSRLTPGPGTAARFAEEMRTVLQGIADVTGGEYFHASSGRELDSIYTRIARIEAPVPESSTREEQAPLAPWLLALALIFLGAEALLKGSRWGVVP